MISRNTLNGRPPRTMRDASRNPFDWIEHEPAPRRTLTDAADVALLLIAAATCVGWIVGALT